MKKPKQDGLLPTMEVMFFPLLLLALAIVLLTHTIWVPTVEAFLEVACSTLS